MEIRIALCAAAQRLQEAGVGEFTWRDLADEADLPRRFSAREQVTVLKATVRNMAQAGELAQAGTVRTRYACRPMVVFRWVGAPRAMPAPGAELQGLLAGWLGRAGSFAINGGMDGRTAEVRLET